MGKRKAVAVDFVSVNTKNVPYFIAIVDQANHVEIANFATGNSIMRMAV